jgi:hypothetical protein
MGIEALDHRTAEVCDCEDFRVSNPQIESAQLLAWTHGQNYTGAVMRFCPWCGRPLFPFPGPHPEPPPSPAPGTPEWFEAVERAQAEILEMWKRMDRELFGRRAGVGPPQDTSKVLSTGLPPEEGVLMQDAELKCDRCGHELKHHSFLFGRWQGACFICASGFPSWLSTTT